MNPVLSTQMGTRHRAGIGITEETDAIAVMVSEESGAISMAVGGKIERDLSAEQLRERLSQELRRYMAPVALPTAVQRDEDSEAGLESPLRARAPMSADGDDDPEMERPL
jgi:diadenylate cyclase